MELFRTLAQSLGDGLTATLVIKTTANGKMTICTNFTTNAGAISETLAPFTLKGTPQEMDEGFLDAIAQPIETVKGLVSNIEAFKKSAEKAAKDATAQKTGAKTPAVNDAVKRAEEERKRKAAEATARKANFDKAIAAARDANAHGNYFTAEAFMELASTLTDDKKVKADLTKQIKSLQGQKEGFLCVDDADAAKKSLEEFKKDMVQPVIEQEEQQEAAQPEPEPETEPEESEAEPSDEAAEQEENDVTEAA